MKMLIRTQRDEDLTRAYVDGRNAARDGKPRNAPDFYDDLETVNWECGYDDMWHDLADDHVGTYSDEP